MACSALEGYERKNEKAMAVTDRVCGIQVEIDEAAAQAEHDGWAYFFCSAQCHQLFSKSPKTYANRGRHLPFSPTAETDRRHHGKG